ncbi:Disease resistance protein RUN1 [Linum perenne]
MASTSSSSSSGSEYHGPWEYDVFLCFRGETRTSFTSHVMAALSEKKIRTFIDTMLGKGNSITDLLSVLKRSALSVIIFSERFAESTWCLDEVATISRSMKEFGHRVLPVFYNVDPSEVDGETGSYAAMIESQDGSKYPPSVKMKWRSALKEVVDKAGLTSCEIRHDSQLIKAIVDNVWKELVDMSPRLKPKNLIGMDSRVWEVERLLDMNRSDDIRVVGLWGMSGMGKTTLARALYQRFTNFLKEDTGKKHYFVQNINAKWKGRPDNLEGLQKELYATLLSEQDQNITSGDLETSYRRARLSRLKVFIVLDDVEYWSQLEQLLLGDVLNLTKLFALGSRIIVTTRNRKVLESAMARIYHVEKLNPQESLRLFSLYSFRREVPPEDRRYQSITAVGYCQGYPLALRVLGCALFRKSKSYWQSYLDGLRKTGKQEIHGVLRKSYDELARDEKPMFLDIACFFRRNYSKSNLIKMMESSYYSAYSRVEDLIDKALLICDQSSDHEGSNDDVGGQIIEVHDLLHQMAWNIIGEEPELANRTRLENPNDIHKLLTTRKDFVNLRWFDLSYCKNLTIVPDLSKATHLESLKLAGCKSIVELPSFVEYLDKLITLDVGACENLEILPPKLGSKHLKHVIISNCRKIKQCPELVSNWDNLDLHGTPITTLPSSIYSVKQAQTLYLHGQSITTFPQFSPTLKGFYLCHTAIEKLPHQRPSDSSKYNLPRIAQLQLIENSKLVKFSRNIWNIVTTELIIIGSPMLEMLPEIPENPTARDLRVLVVEQCKTFKRLPSSINILKSLEVLSLTGAAIRLMPLCIQDLEQLRTLDMSHCKSLESLPSTISMLGRLSQIYLVGCLSLRSLPELPQSVKTLAAGNCKSLQAVSSSNFRKLHFRHLSFVGCNQLDEKLLGQLMAKLPRHDATSLQSPYVGRVGERHPTTVLYPGSELPEWFAYKSMGDSVTFPLPKNSKRLKGISFAAVYALGASNDKDEDIHLHMKCDCFIKPAGSHGCASDDVGVVEKWIVCMSNFHDCVSTDHVFLWSDHKPEPTLSSSGENDEYEGGEAWYVKYSGMDLSFRFSTDVKRGDIKHCKIKRCGVSLAFHTVGNL